MSITLGEKLRQAREARGVSISEVAEQTRISGLYLQAIENDDYRTLPGGIFNKGFVKSYAKYVGIDEQEALADYGALLGTQNNSQITEEPKTYRPQVMTDDNQSSSSVKTIIFAVVILGVMATGILLLKNYIESNQNDKAAVSTNSAENANVNLPNTAAVPNTNTATAAASAAPSMNDLKVEVKAVNAPVYVSSTADGKKASTLMSPDKPLNFEPKENLRISYSKSLAQNVQMTINGKQITVPTAAANPGRNVVEFQINKDNLASVWESGNVSSPAGAPANAPR